VAEAREPIAEAVPVETVVPPDETDVAVAVPVPAARAVGEIFRDAFTSGTGSGPELVVLPRGLFVMGSPDTEAGRHTDEGPLRTVSIDYTLAVGRYEVTWNEWDACVADGGCESNLEKAPSWGSKGDAGWGKGRRPVINVSWNDAQAYVTWLNRRTGLADRADRYRLLSEAEWEYAARGVTSATAPSTPFYTGATISTDQANYDGNYTYGSGRKGVYREKTVEAGSFAPNPFGLYDMAGNVWEWVEDCYEDTYSGKPTDGAVFTESSCSNRVFRGGSWGSVPQFLRSADRGRSTPDVRGGNLGFRLTRTLPR
jgi:formylglycine-generating enzyme required for sulfatase activity